MRSVACGQVPTSLVRRATHLQTHPRVASSIVVCGQKRTSRRYLLSRGPQPFRFSQFRLYSTSSTTFTSSRTSDGVGRPITEPDEDESSGINVDTDAQNAPDVSAASWLQDLMDNPEETLRLSGEHVHTDTEAHREYNNLGDSAVAWGEEDELDDLPSSEHLLDVFDGNDEVLRRFVEQEFEEAPPAVPAMNDGQIPSPPGVAARTPPPPPHAASSAQRESEHGRVAYAEMNRFVPQLTVLDQLHLPDSASPLATHTCRVVEEEKDRSRRALLTSCVMVVFAANDLRVHDNYCLALATLRAEAAGNIPVVAVCVVDYRCFAQPSAVGGFFRQSPQRATFFLESVRELRLKLERTLGIPLLIRCGRPEEHIPRLALELGAVDVFLTTQYAPHEKVVHDTTMQRLQRGEWVSRRVASLPRLPSAEPVEGESSPSGAESEKGDVPNSHETVRIHLVSKGEHPLMYALEGEAPDREALVAHSVWQTTLVHLDDLPTPVSAMKDGERWYHDDVTTATIRPTHTYDDLVLGVASGSGGWREGIEHEREESLNENSVRDDRMLSSREVAASRELYNNASLPYRRSRLTALPKRWDLLPSMEELRGSQPAPIVRGSIPTLHRLGYRHSHRGFTMEEVIATQSSHPAGEDAAIERVQEWLTTGGATSLMRIGRDRRTNTKMYSQKLSRLSPYLSNGSLSPRTLYEMMRRYTYDNLRDGFVQTQYREALLRLSRRDYWHWMGIKYGNALFFSYGPRPDDTSDLADWRHDKKIVQRWCLGLTGIPFADAAMRELVTTGFVAHEGRQALAWLLTRGYGQDWRLGAEWMERCSLDYDPFLCYGNYAYYCGLIKDDFGEPIRTIHYLAHQHDQTGIYVKKWLPQLSKIPPVYIHRPHILTERMQRMHQVILGKNYCYPIKLWDGAQYKLSGQELTTYVSPQSRDAAHKLQLQMGYAEALRVSAASTASSSAQGKTAESAITVLLPEEERNLAVHPNYLADRPWTAEVLLLAEDSGNVAGSQEDHQLYAEIYAAAAKRQIPASKLARRLFSGSA